MALREFFHSTQIPHFLSAVFVDYVVQGACEQARDDIHS